MEVLLFCYRFPIHELKITKIKVTTHDYFIALHIIEIKEKLHREQNRKLRIHCILESMYGILVLKSLGAQRCLNALGRSSWGKKKKYI